MAQQPTYQQVIAQARAERAQREKSQMAEYMRTEYQQRIAERDAAYKQGDWDSFHQNDSEAQHLEEEWQHEFPQNPQQQWWNNCTPAEQEFCRKSPLFQKLPFDQAANILTLASQHAIRLGATRGSEEYFELARRSLEMHLDKETHGVDFDRSEENLTATEAAKISGISADVYNRNARALAANGQTGPKYWNTHGRKS